MRHLNHQKKRKLNKSFNYLSSNPKPKDGRCQKCGEIKPLTKHHVIPKSDNGPSAQWNLKWICRDCHDEIHGIVKKQKPESIPEQVLNRISGEKPFTGNYPIYHCGACGFKTDNKDVLLRHFLTSHDGEKISDLYGRSYAGGS